MNRPLYNSPRLVALAAGVLISLLSFLPGRAEEIFRDLAEMTHVESTYVSGRMAHNQKLWQSRHGSHAMNLSEGFSSLYTYQCYSQQSVSRARRILEDYLKKDPKMELVMRTRESGEDYTVYERFTSDNRLTRMIIFSQTGANLCEIVVVDWKEGLQR